MAQGLVCVLHTLGTLSELRWPPIQHLLKTFKGVSVVTWGNRGVKQPTEQEV